MILNILVPLEIILPPMILAFPTLLVLTGYVVPPGVIRMLSPEVAVEVLFLGAAARTTWYGTLVVFYVIISVLADCAKVLARLFWQINRPETHGGRLQVAARGWDGLNLLKVALATMGLPAGVAHVVIFGHAV